ncbi:MAG: DUF3841 domain-containing protein [Eubacteriales bacterium]|nr:DUF3841 domain-containing protein [Eubacteriales bacterium]
MKLWTLQPLSILDEIERTGSYRCNRELSYNLSKRDSLDDKYQWLIKRMEQRIGKRPEGVEYPIWAWHTWEEERRCPDIQSAAFLKRTEDKVLLTLEIPENEIVLTDFDAWQIILNGGYLALETAQEKLDELEEWIDSLEEEELDRAIEESWENLFEIAGSDSEERGRFVQATFWELKKEYILKTDIVEK